MLAALAAAVPRLRIGPLVTGNTYRHPAVLAKMAAKVDQISGGRVVLGLGAGWQENEHHAYGIEFSTVGGRLARLDEACQVIKGLFTQRAHHLPGQVLPAHRRAARAQAGAGRRCRSSSAAAARR